MGVVAECLSYGFEAPTARVPERAELGAQVIYVGVLHPGWFSRHGQRDGLTGQNLMAYIVANSDNVDMKFFFPDSVDTVDPGYDFEREAYAHPRIRQRREAYAHELLAQPPYHGLLVSMAVSGFRGPGSRRYTQSQQFRLFYGGVHRFFRLEELSLEHRVETMGDTGAYAYAYEEEPPITAVEVLDFYDRVGFDYGLAPDHVVPGFLRDNNEPPPSWVRRRDASLSLAEAFLREHRDRESSLVPIGVAQGWSPESYAEALSRLEAMGYAYVALGGLAPLRTRDILASIEAVAATKQPSTRLHLLGLARPAHLKQFAAWGVASLDTTMPLKQAFQDDQHNYHTLDHRYLAVRVPPTEGNVRLDRLIRKGETTRREARRLERASLTALRAFDRGEERLEAAVRAASAYEVLFNGRDHADHYRELSRRPRGRRAPAPFVVPVGSRSSSSGGPSATSVGATTTSSSSTAVSRHSLDPLPMPFLRIPALAFTQGPVTLYAFAFDGTRLREFATISRVRRSEGTLLGYQRPAIRRHVAAIRSYLESESPRLPNALVLAFDERVRFQTSRGRPGGTRPRVLSAASAFCSCR